MIDRTSIQQGFARLSRNQKILSCVVLALLVWFIGSGVKRVLGSGLRAICERMMDDDRANQFEDRMVTVEIETAKMGPISRRIRTIGRLRANAFVELKSETSARVRDIPVSDGALVEAGDVLIQFEDAETKARLAGSKAEVIFYKAEYERVSKLQGQNFESRKKLEETLGKLDGAKAKVEELEATLAKLTLRAPFKGKVGLLNIHKGAYVQPGQDLISSLVDNSSLRIDFKIPEKFIGQIGAGQTAEIQVETFEAQTFQSTVDAIEPKSESESHSVKVRSSMKNPQNMLQHGMFCRVSLIVGEKPSALLIEESSLEREGEIEYVWVIEKGKAIKRRVLTGTHENGKAEITAGLSEGEMVVIAGQLKLYPGVRVKITNLTQTADPAQKSDKTPAAAPTVQTSLTSASSPRLSRK